MKMFILIILLVFVKLLINKLNNKHNVRSNSNITYSKKQLMTKYERYFYDVLIELKDELNIEVMPQVNLGTIVNKKSNNRWQNELFRNIDFGIFTREYEELLLLIEINDKTHNNYNRKYRDMKVDNIVNNAGIKLIKFYSNYPNKRDYIKNRIREEINKL